MRFLVTTMEQEPLFSFSPEKKSKELVARVFPSRQVLFVDDGVMMYKWAPGSCSPFEESDLPSLAHECRSVHTLRTLSERTITETLLMAYLAQANYSEPLFPYIRRLQSEPLEHLRDMRWLLANKAPFRYKVGKNTARYPTALQFADGYGGIERLAEDYLSDPFDFREFLYDNINGMGYKTASYWHFLMGGEGLFTLDQHVLEQASGLGVAMPERFVTPKPRASGIHKGSSIRESPSGLTYLQIESRLADLLADFSSKPVLEDTSYWTSVLWYAGVLEDRRQRSRLDPRQTSILGHQTRFIYPYSE